MCVRVYVSKAAFVGKTVREIPLPDFPVMISHVRRGDLELIASSDLTIEFGDLHRGCSSPPVGKRRSSGISATASRAMPNCPSSRSVSGSRSGCCSA